MTLSPERQHPARLMVSLVLLLILAAPSHAQHLLSDPLFTPSTAAASTGSRALLPPDVLHKLGAQTYDTPPAAKTFGTSYDYTPYGAFAYGAEGYALGHSGGLLPGFRDAYRACPGCFGGATYLEVDQATISNAIRMADDALASSAAMLDFMNPVTSSGSWNQFYGQQPVPSGWDTNPYNSYGNLDNAAYQALFGLDASAAVNYVSNYISDLYVMISPYLQSPGWGYGKTGGRQQHGSAYAALAERFAALGEEQLAHYYTDPDVQELRLTGDAVLLYLLISDPLYVYYSYWLQGTMQQIYTATATYTSYVGPLLQEMSTWTATNNADELQARTYKRMLLSYYTAWMEYEVYVFFYYNPQVYANVELASQWVGSRTAALLRDADVEAWYAGWQQDYAHTFTVTSEVEAKTEAILADYPTFRQYADLNREIVDLLPTLQDETAVQQATETTLEVLGSEQVRQALGNAVNTYTAEVQNLLGATNFAAEMERYYGRVNSRLGTDADFQAVTAYADQQWQRLLQYEYAVYAAVNNCFARYGNACNPALDPATQSLVGSDDVIDLAVNLSVALDDLNAYWYDFYNGGAYHQIETDARARMASTFSQITPQVESAKARFRNAVDNISEIKSHRRTMLELAGTLRSTSVAGKTGSTTLGQMLDQMAALRTALESGNVAGEADPAVPTTMMLYPNYPNPFNPSTTIRFDLPEAGPVRLQVLDLLGREVARLVDDVRPAGTHTVSFDAHDLANGVYLYRLEADRHVATRRMVLIK